MLSMLGTHSVCTLLHPISASSASDHQIHEIQRPKLTNQNDEAETRWGEKET